MPSTTRTVKNLLSRAPAPLRDRAGKALLRGYETWLSRRDANAGPSEHGGLPVPPAKLRVLIAGDSDLERFLVSGERENGMVRDAIARAGRPVEALSAILDWGCGCGRVTRWWADLQGVAVTACDYNPELVDWVGANLPFAQARRNQLEPPLPVADASQDLVYAFSVLTHLPDELALAWMREIRRVLRPGGLFFFTTHGEACSDRVTPDQARALARGESVVQFSGIAGTNLCAAYHPRAFVEARLADGFEVIEAVEAHLGGADAQTGMVQDRYLLRRPV